MADDEYPVGSIWTTRGGWEAVVVKNMRTHILVTHTDMSTHHKVKRMGEVMSQIGDAPKHKTGTDYQTITLMHYGTYCCGDRIDDDKEARQYDLIQRRMV